VVALLAVVAPRAALAHHDGTKIVGHSGMSTGVTCGNCHDGGAKPAVMISGPATLTAGATGQYTLTVMAGQPSGAEPVAAVAGLDIAVSDPQAQLSTVGGAAELVRGELVHPSPEHLSGGMATFTFALTASASGGNITLYAAGLAGNGDGTPLGDKAAITTFEVAVSGGSGATGSWPVNSGVGGVGSNAAGPGGGGEPAMEAPRTAGCALGGAPSGSPALPIAVVALVLAGATLARRRLRAVRGKIAVRRRPSLSGDASWHRRSKRD
jgi:hypothetical protein